MSSRGLFVVLEGFDGAGTTTQCTALAERLRQAGREALGRDAVTAACLLELPSA